MQQNNDKSLDRQKKRLAQLEINHDVVQKVRCKRYDKPDKVVSLDVVEQT